MKKNIHMKSPSSLKVALIFIVLIAGFIFLLNETELGNFLRAQLTGSTPHCSDGVDNDADGKTDYPADLGCLRADGTNEYQDGECFDNIDNDGDGAIDAADFSCRILFNGENMPKSFCQDGIDNDKDGFTDLADQGCTNGQDHSENN